MKKILVACITAAAFCSAPAFAADMPVKATPMAAPISNWTGFYAGIEGGGGWGKWQHTNANNGATSDAQNIDGGIFGATYGYNWQHGSIVAGFEGDISWSGIKSSFGPGNGFCTATNCVTDLQWLGTDRARIGFVWDRVLVYGTGGVAYGDVNATCCGGGAFTSETKMRAGPAFGGGLESMFAPNWSAKLEYLHVDLGDKINYHVIPTNVGEKVSLKFDIVRLGINYRFGNQ